MARRRVPGGALTDLNDEKPGLVPAEYRVQRCGIPAGTPVALWGRGGTTVCTRDAIRTAPAYDSWKLISRDYEVALHKHYGLIFDKE